MEGSVARKINPTMEQPGEIDWVAIETTYKDERRLLIDRGHEAQRDLDRWLLTISGGALGLSITLLGLLAAGGWRFQSWILGASWFLFAVAIVVVLFSIRASTKCYEEFADLVDESAREDYAQWQYIAREKQSKSTRPTQIEYLNIAGMIAVTLGILALALFACTITRDQINGGINGGSRQWQQGQQAPETPSPST